jgi:hypothetical protein
MHGLAGLCKAKSALLRSKNCIVLQNVSGPVVWYRSNKEEMKGPVTSKAGQRERGVLEETASYLLILYVRSRPSGLIRCSAVGTTLRAP